MTKSDQCVKLFELEGGCFIEIRQEKESLTILVPPRMPWWEWRQYVDISGGLVMLIFGIPVLLYFTIVAFDNETPLVMRILPFPLFLVAIVFWIRSVANPPRGYTLKFTNTCLRIEWRILFFRFWKRVPLNQIGKARTEMFDDLYLDWPRDIVYIPLGKNNCFNIFHIKRFEDQKDIANLINSFRASMLDKK